MILNATDIALEKNVTAIDLFLVDDSRLLYRCDSILLWTKPPMNVRSKVYNVAQQLNQWTTGSTSTHQHLASDDLHWSVPVFAM